MTKEDYDAQKAVYNRTIQYTVAAAMEGVIPERVTDITVEQGLDGNRDSETAIFGSALPVNSVQLKYKVTVHDPVLTVEKLRELLVQSANAGKMDTDLRYFAVQFGAANLNNGTFAEPQVTSAAVQRGSSSRLTGVQIALLVISVFVCLAVLAVFLWFMMDREESQAPPVTQNVQQLDSVM